MGRFTVSGQHAKGKTGGLPICHRSFFTNVGCHWGHAGMDKTELIECIREINRTAKVEFLETFAEEDLHAYLEHLMELDLEEVVAAS